MKKQTIGHFCSVIEAQQLFTKVQGVLNSRALLFNGESYVRIIDLMCPNFAGALNDPPSVLSDNCEKYFQQFCDLFSQSVTQGATRRNGGKSVNTYVDITTGDFVMVKFPSRLGYFKYGLIERKAGKHTYSVKMLVKRSKGGSGSIGTHIIDVQNLVLLHRPSKVDENK